MNPHLGPSNDKRGTLCARSAYSILGRILLHGAPYACSRVGFVLRSLPMAPVSGQAAG